MGLSQGCAAAGALLLAISAWLLAGAFAGSHPLWPYLLFGAVFVVLLAHVMRIAVDERPAFSAAVLSGIPLAIAAYWLGKTPYRWLEYACWAYAAAYLLLVPRMMRAVGRVPRMTAAEAPGGGAKGAFDLRDIAIAMGIVVTVSGLLLCTAFVAGKWGFYAGVGAVLLWPVTLIVVPWYAAIAHGGWLAMAVVYGGGLAALLLYRSTGARPHRNAADIPHSETGTHR